MFTRLTSACRQQLGKWGAYVVLLIVPGSFVTLPVLWLIRRYAANRPSA